MELPAEVFASPDPLTVRVPIDADELHSSAAGLLGGGYRLALIAAHHDPGNHFRVVYLFTSGPPDHRVELHLDAGTDDPQVPSLAALSFPANRFEREIQDLFGITPIGHHAPRRLVLHNHWPRDWHPMRRDAGPPPPMIDTGEPYPFVPVEGPGIYEIPVGPVHAGLIEPGHFRFFAVGETIVRMKARLWFVHKGIEALFAGRSPDSGIDLAERISGDTAVGHSLAYCLAVEDASGTHPPRPAQVLRAVLLELERLYNHIADLGALCNDAGYGIVQAHALRIRERLMQLNASITGHRLLRGAIYPGGATVAALPRPADLDEIAADVAELVDLALANSTVQDRFTGTGILDRSAAAEIGALGFVARGSGLHLDARIAHPFVDLTPNFSACVQSRGDVLARFAVRAKEFDASVSLLHHLLDELAGQTSPPAAMPSRQEGAASGIGIVEGWRGSIVHRIEIDGGSLHRVKIVDPSFMNWPGVPIALADTIVPDFPLINKSFNQSYAGNDL